MSVLDTHTFEVTLIDSLQFKHIIHFERKVVDVDNDEAILRIYLAEVLSHLNVLVVGVKQKVQ